MLARAGKEIPAPAVLVPAVPPVTRASPPLQIIPEPAKTVSEAVPSTPSEHVRHLGKSHPARPSACGAAPTAPEEEQGRRQNCALALYCAQGSLVRILLGSLVMVLFLQGPAPQAQEAQDTNILERAHKHYESGVSLFESGNKEQALVEFQLANEIAPKKENIFMIAQCEYHLGQLVAARTHYEAYLAEEKQGELADLARLRIEAIQRRPGVFAINTVPDAVEVRIEGEGTAVTGQAPNEFRVPRGHYRVTASKANFGSETRELSIEVAETKPIFFKLEPIPAHLSVRTVPPSAALFIRGNRAQNPYVQDVPPGSYEIYAESSYYQPKRETIWLNPGEDRTVNFPLSYVQRSGRPELIGFWTGIGAVGGGLAVLTQGNPDLSKPLSLSLLSAGVLAGGLGLGVLSSTTPTRARLHPRQPSPVSHRFDVGWLSGRRHVCHGALAQLDGSLAGWRRGIDGRGFRRLVAG
jgi:hypothetical protein